MPPKKRGGRGGSGRGRGRSASTRGSSRKGKYGDSASEGEAGASSDEDQVFAKDKLLSVMRYDFTRLCQDSKFDQPNLTGSISPEEFNMEYYEKTGLDVPLLFHCDPAQLGMKVPDAATFDVDTVLSLVGGKRRIEVVEVSAQGGVKMSLEEFVAYYKTEPEKRTTLYNVLSLEFTLTKLVDLVCGPDLVRQVDWVTNHWPDALRQRMISFTNKGLYQTHQTFPKVQNYCLMSVSKCYTDFHIDFGGTSVWYHVLKGKKIFWMIEPTEGNLRLYEEFIKNPEQTGFFGDVVDVCARVVLNPGDTMLIPSGWIHAVYTPVDSLVFGGNFIHTLQAGMQIRVYQSENKINVTRKFRFPYLDQLILYYIADFVRKTTGRVYCRPLKISEHLKLDYVGKKWIENKGHHIEINDVNFKTGLADGDMPRDDLNDEGLEPGTVNVIAMHAENSIYADTGLEDEMDEADSDKDLFNPDPLIFYNDSSILFDMASTGGTQAHKDHVDLAAEPALQFIQEAVGAISPRRLVECERLCQWMKSKRVMEVAEGISRPASLLLAFQAVLHKRREDLTALGVELEPPGTVPRAQRKGRRSSQSYQSVISPVKRTSFRRCKAVSDPADLVKKEEDSAMDAESGTDEQPLAALVEAKKEEPVQDDDQTTEAMETDADQQTTTSLTSPTESAGTTTAAGSDGAEVAVETSTTPPIDEAPIAVEEEVDVVGDEVDEKPAPAKKETKKRDRSKRKKAKDDDDSEDERKKKEKKKKKKASDAAARKSFEDALLHNPRSKKKHDPKKDKPQFVGGLPMSSIQDEPVVANPYNYDPMSSIMKLGTGQLQSAYRKTKTNIAPPKEKNLYKLEPKSHEEEGATGGDTITEQAPSHSNTPLSISIKERHSRERSQGSPSPAPPARASFIPSYNDMYSPTQPEPPSRRVSSSGGSWERPPNTGGGAMYSPGMVSARGSRGSTGSDMGTSPGMTRPMASRSYESPVPAPLRDRIPSFDSPNSGYSQTTVHSASSHPTPSAPSPVAVPINDRNGDQFSAQNSRPPQRSGLASPPPQRVPVREDSWRTPNERRPADPRRAPPAERPLIPALEAIAQLQDIIREMDRVNALHDTTPGGRSIYT